MSIAMVSLVLSRKFGSTARKAVAIKLADCANEDGENIFPAVSTIAAEAEVSERTARSVLKDFREVDKLLVVTREGGRGGSGLTTTTQYKFDVGKIKALPLVRKPKIDPQNGGAKSAPLRGGGVQPASARGANSADSGCSSCTLTVLEPSLNLTRADARKEDFDLDEKGSGAQPNRAPVDLSGVTNPALRRVLERIADGVAKANAAQTEAKLDKPANDDAQPARVRVSAA